MTAREQQARRARQMTLIYAVMTCLILLVFVQLLLLMVAVNAYLGGGASGLWPSAAASAGCFAASCWLIRPLERGARRPGGS